MTMHSRFLLILGVVCLLFQDSGSFTPWVIPRKGDEGGITARREQFKRRFSFGERQGCNSKRLENEEIRK